MARRRSGNKDRLPPFVAIFWSILNSRAYRELPNAAKGMLPYFLGKVKIPVKSAEYYETSFSFSYSEAANHGCARRTFHSVIQALIRHGFIDPVRKGGLRSDKKSLSYFRLSKRWMSFGTALFERMEWKEYGQEQIRKEYAA